MSQVTTGDEKNAAAMTEDEIDLYYCPGCDGDKRADDHFGCTYCGDCTCQGGC